MLQIAGEVLQQRAEMPFMHHAQVNLNAVVQIHGCLRIAVSQHIRDIRQGHQRVQHLRRVVRRANEIDVADGLFVAAQAAARHNPPDFRALLSQRGDESVAYRLRARDWHSLVLAALELQLSRDVGGGLLAQTRQRFQPAVVYRRLQAGNIRNAQFKP